jgi:hypothetical protein
VAIGRVPLGEGQRQSAGFVVGRVQQKLRLSGRAELVAYALDRGLIKA